MSCHPMKDGNKSSWLSKKKTGLSVLAVQKDSSDHFRTDFLISLCDESLGNYNYLVEVRQRSQLWLRLGKDRLHG